MKKYFHVTSDAATDDLFVKHEHAKPTQVLKCAQIDPFEEINKRNALVESAKKANAAFVHDRTQILVREGKSPKGDQASAKVAPTATDVEAFIKSAFHN